MQSASRKSRVEQMTGEMSRQAATRWGPEAARTLGPQIAETAEWISLIDDLDLGIWADEPDFIGFPPFRQVS